MNAVARRRFVPHGGAWSGARLDAVLPQSADGTDGWPESWPTSPGAGAGETHVQLAAGRFAASLAAGPPGGLHVLTLREIHEILHRRSDMLRAVADSSHDAVLALDRDGLVTAVSARAELVLGYSERALLGRPMSVVVEEGGRDELDALVRVALEGVDVVQHDTKARPRDGTVADIVVNLAPLRATPDGEIVGVSAILQDITERKRLERELRHLSERDALTGVYNRRHLEIELRRAARLAERHGDAGAVIVLDVDRFKDVNDTHGHPGGDQLLRDLSRALSASVRDSDVVARLGGDEFAVLLPKIDRHGASATAQKILTTARAALRPWESSVSVGTACFGVDTTFDPDRVLTAADRALYAAKAAGGDAVQADRRPPESGYARSMPHRSFDAQITKYLTDAHAIEVQALEQMRLAPRIAGDPELREIFRAHFDETAEHERLVRGELQSRGAKPSPLKDVAGRVGGWGMVAFAKANPDTPGKLAMHAYSYEHMELAAYELLRRVAERAGDPRVAELARRIGADERAMADRVGERWDRAVDASLREKGADDIAKEVVKYLRDAHALEAQALQMLEAGPMLAEFDALKQVFREHANETREHQRLVDERLSELGSGPGRFQAGAMRASALNLGGFFKAQPDTPVKLAGFAYAFEALECGAYELLWRTARRAGDERTATIAQGILLNEQDTAQRVAGTWDAAVDAALATQGVTG